VTPSPTRPDKPPDTLASAVTDLLHFQVKWFKFAQWIGMFMLLYLFGPVIFFARALQREASAQIWQSSYRWAIVRRTSFLSLLWYIPLIMYHAPLTVLWSALFMAVSHVFHFPALAKFGAITLFPPTPMNILFRWFLALPLASLLACVFELIQPLTNKSFRRVLIPEEQAQLASHRAKQTEKTMPTKKAVKPSEAQASNARPSSTSQQKTAKSTAQQKNTAAAQGWPQKLTPYPQADAQEKVRRQREPHIIVPATPTNRSANSPTQSTPRYTWDEGEGMIDS
jgi:hypothetical protein